MFVFFGIPSSKTVLVLLIASLLLLLIAELTVPVVAGEVVWDIITDYSEIFSAIMPIPPGIIIPVYISLTASGAIKVTSPSNNTSTFIVPQIDSDGFSHVFTMPEIGKHQIEETYKLVFEASGIVNTTTEFEKTDSWTYTNPTPSLALFQLEDTFVDNYSASISPSHLFTVGDNITPSPGRPGDEGKIEIITIGTVGPGDIEIAMVFEGDWHKISSMTLIPDNEAPAIVHSPLQSIQVGVPVVAKVTDNIAVSSVTLNFKDGSYVDFQQIPMTPAGEDNYEAYIPINVKGGNGQYYLEAVDLVGNDARSPDTGSHPVLVNPFGDVNGNGIVDDNDAESVLQHSVGLIELPVPILLLADVTGNGNASPYDSGLILQYAEGLIDTFPVQIGGLSLPNEVINQSLVELEVPSLAGLPGSEISVPVNASHINETGIIGIYLSLEYDPGILEAINVSRGTITTDWEMIAYRITNGQVIIGMANLAGLTGEGSITSVRFVASQDATGGQTSPLNLPGMSLNEGAVPVDISNGMFEVIEQIVLELNEGFNLFSIGIDMGSDDLLSILESIEGIYKSIWTTGSWRYYFPDGPHPLDELTSIVPEKGYWIDMDACATLTFTGVRLANTSISLEQGWNLVGYKSPNEINVEDAQFFSPGDGTSIFTYENGAWKKYYSGGPSFLNDLSKFKPGKGYYIYVTEARQWNLPR